MKGSPKGTMPIDRMRMRPWLEDQIDSGVINGLIWIDKEKKIFQIPWLHAARHGWELGKDAPLFMNWAIHTGKYHPGVDQPDPKTWKANFRCAMNSLPDIEEVKDKSSKKGNNAIKVYRMLSTTERARKKEKRKFEKKLVKEKNRNKSGDEITNARATKRQGKVAREADSTIAIDLKPIISSGSYDDDPVIHEMADVCAVVEVTTEVPESPTIQQVSPKTEASPVSSSSTIYPILQVSASSSSGESHDESENSDEDPEGWDMRRLSEPQITCSVVRFPSCKPPSKCTFFNSERINFKVTSCQEESPIIAYNVRPRWSLHVATRPVTVKVHSDPPQAHPRHSGHIVRQQTGPQAHNQTSPLVRPQNTKQITPEVHSPAPPQPNTQVPTQTNINVRAQAVSHMFPLRSPHMPVQSIAHLRPPTIFHQPPQRSVHVVHRYLGPRSRLLAAMRPPIRPENSIETMFRHGLPHQLSGQPKQIELTSPQLPLHTSLHHVSPHAHPYLYPKAVSQAHLHGGPLRVPAPEVTLQNKSLMRVLTRPDIVPKATDPNSMPHHSPHVTTNTNTNSTSPTDLRRSSPPDETQDTDGRASVIVNAGVKS
ncbi:interferon regulatory factor 2a [Engraulis encrasicolus]|uniref:interferon regulatory factor 2a n=1 Tax=Engraulis encrasicolus TaxID=184585 RepID=UPI002FD73D53